MNPLTWFSGPYALIIKISLVVALLGSVYAMGYTKGNKRATDACEAAKMVELRKYQAEYQKAVDRANVLAQKLATRETQIIYRTKEVIKNVPKVTDGKSCLNSAAVRMLNHRDTTVPETTGKPVTESAPDAPVTDTDTAYWIADAISQYEIAAARLNALIDYFEKSQ